MTGSQAVIPQRVRESGVWIQVFPLLGNSFFQIFCIPAGQSGGWKTQVPCQNLSKFSKRLSTSLLVTARLKGPVGRSRVQLRGCLLYWLNKPPSLYLGVWGNYVPLEAKAFHSSDIKDEKMHRACGQCLCPNFCPFPILSADLENRFTINKQALGASNKNKQWVTLSKSNFSPPKSWLWKAPIPSTFQSLDSFGITSVQIGDDKDWDTCKSLTGHFKKHKLKQCVHFVVKSPCVVPPTVFRSHLSRPGRP